MLTVDTIAKIRRAFFVEKKSIKAICRELKRSRTAVRRAIRSEATEFRYERSVQPMPKLGTWRKVRLMPAQYVKPYVKRGKNDAADAEAICEAVTRPTMRFVPVKTAEQQSVMM